ncbi:MAG: branched-chain amino acid ABC transporter permease [Bradyrhizobium sp.]
MTSTSLLLNLVIDGFVQGCTYAMLAAGFSLLWWVSGIVHLAHGGVMLAGGFGLYVVLSAFGVPIIPAIAIGAACSVVAGLAIDTIVYQPLLRRRTDEMGLLTASLGALIVLEYVLTIAFGPEGATLDPEGLRSPVFPGFLPVLDRFSALILLTTGIIFGALHLVMTHTGTGRSLRAVADNPDLARVIGVDTPSVYRQVAALAAVLSLPAAAFLLFNTGLAPNEALHIVLVSAVVAIIGGRGSMLGALVAGLAIGVAESATTWQLATGWRQLVTFAFLYFLLLVRPQGLFGKLA